MVTPADSYDLRLYVVDRMASGQRAIDNLHRVYTERLDGRCTIEIVDLGEQPQRARADDIVAVPTLVRDSPQPRRVVGDLSNTDQVLAGLSLRHLRP